MAVSWEWMTDSHLWKPYSPATSSAVEAAFQALQPSLEVCIASGPVPNPPTVNSHSITFQTQLPCQITWGSGRSRPVRRNVDPQTGTVEWQWWEDVWRPYDVTINAQIESAWGQCYSANNAYFQASSPGGVSIRIRRQKYVVEFEADAVQRNLYTQFTRKVRRRMMSPGTAGAGASAAAFPSVPLPQQVAPPTVAAGTVSLSYDAGDLQPFVDTSDDDCPICVMSLSCSAPAIMLSKCRHVFCKDCIIRWFETRPTCPVCTMAYGVITGIQPNGTMSVRIIPAGSAEFGSGIEGFSNVDIIQIHYNFPSGIQGPEHPSPGQRYTGTKRVAYLPFTKEGEDVLNLLKTAWDRRLLFSVGTSITTGQRDVVTWAGVHHKTSTWGGPTNFGYPDVTYFARVKAELAEKGVK